MFMPNTAALPWQAMLALSCLPAGVAGLRYTRHPELDALWVRVTWAVRRTGWKDLSAIPDRELRDMVFPENKTRAECFEEDIEFDKDKHLLTDENLDEDVLQFVVQNIFKKAQDEKLFCILNGQLCQRIIELEL